MGALTKFLLQRPEHEGERRSKFVTDVAEERGLGAIGFGQGLGPAFLGRVGLRISQGSCDVRLDHGEERAVVVVQRPAGVDPCRQDDGTAIPTYRAERQEEGLPGRFRPGPAGQWSEAVAYVVDDNRNAFLERG